MLNLKNLSYRAWGEDFQLDLSLELYAENKEPAVTAATTEGEPFATITVNVPDTPHGCVAVRDDYPFYPQLLERAGVIEDLLVVDRFESGFITVSCYTLTEDAAAVFRGMGAANV
jgi:hypothetical protein